VAALTSPQGHGETPGFAGEAIVDADRRRISGDLRSATNAVVISHTTGADDDQQSRLTGALRRSRRLVPAGVIEFRLKGQRHWRDP
jgi:hypothetical protein